MLSHQSSTSSSSRRRQQQQPDPASLPPAPQRKISDHDSPPSPEPQQHPAFFYFSSSLSSSLPPPPVPPTALFQRADEYDYYYDTAEFDEWHLKHLLAHPRLPFCSVTQKFIRPPANTAPSTTCGDDPDPRLLMAAVPPTAHPTLAAFAAGQVLQPLKTHQPSSVPPSSKVVSIPPLTVLAEAYPPTKEEEGEREEGVTIAAVKRRRDDVAEENDAWVRSLFATDRTATDGPATATTMTTTTTCRNCGAQVCRRTDSLLRHAVSKSCVVRRLIGRNLWGLNGGFWRRRQRI